MINTTVKQGRSAPWQGLMSTRSVGKCVKSIYPQLSPFYLVFTGHEQEITPGQHVSDTHNEGCPLTGDPAEASYLVVQRALQGVDVPCFQVHLMKTQLACLHV